MRVLSVVLFAFSFSFLCGEPVDALMLQDPRYSERGQVHPVDRELQLPEHGALPGRGLEEGGARGPRHDRLRQQLVHGMVRNRREEKTKD